MNMTNFIGTKFLIFDGHPPHDSSLPLSCMLQQRIHQKQVLPKAAPATATVSYQLNILLANGPRRIHCTMHLIPMSSVGEGGTAPTPLEFSSTCTDFEREPLILENETPRWHEQLQYCGCIDKQKNYYLICRTQAKKILASLIGIGFLVLQQFSGINGVLFYSSTIFQNAGISSSEAATFGVGAVQVLATTLTLWLTDKSSCRLLLIVSSSGMTLSLLVVSIAFYLKVLGKHGSWEARYLLILFFCSSTNMIFDGRFLGSTVSYDLIHEILSVGPHFREANNFLWPFKLKAPLGGLKKKRNHYVEGGDAGNREDKINELIRRMN
ncbi:hypothetical protein TSUD_03570 [Trifolium subterraneum]|nr:hypothetical protein TSUD_03570 [Trifolium subterraneum]